MKNSFVYAKEIAAFFTQKDCVLSKLRLHKILFFVQGYHLLFLGEPAFSDEFQFWGYGPAVPNVFFGDWEKCNVQDNLTPYQKQLLWLICEKTMAMPIREAIHLCMQIYADKNDVRFYSKNPISNEEILEYFFQKDPLGLKESNNFLNACI